MIFALGLVLLGTSICRTATNPDRTARRRYEKIRERGLRSSMFSGAAFALAFGVLALAAFLRADLRLLWAALATVSIVSAALLTIVATFTTGSQSVTYPEVTDERLTLLKRKVVCRSALHTALLTVWVYSWRHLFLPR